MADDGKLGPGDRVALLVPGSALYVDLVISLLAAAIVPVPLDARLTERERMRLEADLEPTPRREHADLADVAVFGVDDLQWGRQWTTTGSTSSR